MNVLMISLDKSLLSNKPLGDVVERMNKYAQGVDRLDILIFNSQNQEKKLSDNLTIFGSGGFSKIVQLLNGLKKAKELSKEKHLITTQDPFFTGLLGWRTSKFYEVPLVVELHGDFFGEEWKKERLINRFLLKIAKIVVKSANKIRVVNAKIKEDLVNLGIDRNKIEIWPVAVNLDKFQQYKEDKVFGIKSDLGGSPLILFAGSLIKTKSVGDLLGAFKLFFNQHKESKLVIIGDGPERKILESKVQELELNNSVAFLGTISQEELINYYHACDFFVLPSAHESFGRVIIEAGSARKPVISTKTSGAVWYLKDGVDGYLVEIHNINELAQKMNYVWEHYDEAKLAGKKLYQKVYHLFHYDMQIQKIIKLWKSVAKV